MHPLLRPMAAVAVASLAFVSGQALAAEDTSCRKRAIEELRASSPDGFSIYKQITDKGFFANWITCDDLQLGLATAVHESVHYITAETDAFPLLNGDVVARPHEVSRLFAPSSIARKFRKSDFVDMYLRPGKSSSSSDFLYLLDELNAYTHDLNAAIDLQRLHPADEEVDHRDGLAAAMAFVAVYVEAAEDSQPDTWAALQDAQVAKTISALWDRAEGVMAASCGIPNFGAEDKAFIRKFCQAKAQASLRTILGRSPVCPTACLKLAPSAEQASDAAEVTRVGSLPRATPLN